MIALWRWQRTCSPVVFAGAVLRFFMRMNNVSAGTGEAMMDLLTKNKMA